MEAGLPVAFGARVSKGFADHFNVTAFVNADVAAAGALHFVASLFGLIVASNAVFMAAQHSTMSNFVVFPQFAFTSSTLNGQHNNVGVEFRTK